MEVGVRGHLGPETVADLIRAAAEARLSGLLRLTAKKLIKVIFFEAGRPVFAISSQSDEQPEQRFIEDGIATAEQINYVKRLISNPNELGPALAKLGGSPLHTIDTALRELAIKIILSTFEWRAGDYFFDPRPGGSHPTDINCAAEDCVVMGARRAAQLDSLLNATAPGTRMVFPSDDQRAAFGRGAKLNSIEGYVLSCIGPQTRVEDISTMTGLADVETRRAVYVLLALALIDAAPEARPAAPPQPPPAVADAFSRSTPTGPRVSAQSSTTADSGRASHDRNLYAAERPVTPPPVVPSTPANGANNETVNILFGESQDTSSPLEQDLLIDFENTVHFPEWGQQPVEGTSAGAPQERVPLGGAAATAGGDASAANQIGDLPNNPYPRGQARTGVEPPNDIRVGRQEQPGWFDSPAATNSSGPFSEPLKQEEAPLFNPESLDQVLSKLENRLEKLDSSNLYQVLGVTKLASKSTIQVAYEGLKRAYDSYRMEWPRNEQLLAHLDSLQGLTEKAYEILSDSEKRRVYDMPKSTPIIPPAPVIERGQAEEMRRPARKEELSAPNRKPLPVEIPKSAPVRPTNMPMNPFGHGVSSDYGGETRNESADDYYRRGRAYYERHDFHTAAHMLRQAVRMDPSRAIYHYHLGVTLGVLSQARQVHKHDEGCHVTCKMGGGLHRNQRVRHEAEQHLLKAAELDPSNPDIRLKLAQLYKEAGMEKKAEQYFHEVLLLNPSNKVAQIELGLVDPEPNIDLLTGRRIKKAPPRP